MNEPCDPSCTAAIQFMAMAGVEQQSSNAIYMCNPTIWQCMVLSNNLQQNSKEFSASGRYSILPSCISYLWLLTHHHSWWCILMRMNAFLFLSLADPTPPTNFSLYLRSTSTFASPQVPSLWHPNEIGKISFRHYQSRAEKKLSVSNARKAPFIDVLRGCLSYPSYFINELKDKANSLLPSSDILSSSPSGNLLNLPPKQLFTVVL